MIVVNIRAGFFGLSVVLASTTLALVGKIFPRESPSVFVRVVRVKSLTVFLYRVGRFMF